MERLVELAAIVGAGAAGAAVAVLAVGGSLLLILPAALIVALITVALPGILRRRRPRT